MRDPARSATQHAVADVSRRDFQLGRRLCGRDAVGHGTCHERFERRRRRQPGEHPQVLLAAGVGRERTLRARAEAEAHKAKAVEEYLVSVFDVADPFAPPGQRGGEVTARALLDRGAARIASAFDREPEVQAELRRVLGTVYVRLGLFDVAEPLLRTAVEQQRALHGDRHRDVAAAMDRLGHALVQMSRFGEAEPLLREALVQRRALLGNANTDTATSMEHLATLYQERSEFDGADTLFREAVAVRRSIQPDHEELANSLSNFGVLLQLRDRSDLAEPLYREALAIQVRRLGNDHPLTAQSAHNLAQLLQQSGRIDEAEALYRRALAAKRKALGNAHPSVTVNLNNLGNLLAIEQGRVDEAEVLVREALALDRQMFRAPHAYIAESLRRLGIVLRLKGEFDQAERTFRDALAMNADAARRRRQGAVAAPRSTVARACGGSGRGRRAAPLTPASGMVGN